MALLEIILLGTFEVRLDDEPVTAFRSDKVRALLAYLALHAGRPHRREALAALLWPDQSETAALHNLRQSLMRLRAALHDQEAAEPCLQVTAKTVQFDVPARCWVDVCAFVTLLEECRRHTHRHLDRCRACAERLAAAAALYHDELLAGFHVENSPTFDEWLAVAREHFHNRALDVLAMLSDFHARHGDYQAAADFARRQVALEPWREEAHRQLIYALMLDGQRSAAIAQYQACRRILADELGVEPADETRVRYDEILSGRLAAQTAGRRPQSLPQPVTSLLGREDELREVAGLLRDPTVRLITLLGPPGIGKTRLAIAVAAAVEAEFEEGARFVSLASTSDPDLVIARIAAALDMRLAGGYPLVESVEEAIGDRELLLVLDNFEQVVGAVPTVSQLLLHCSQLVVLTTSRTPLHVRGEHKLPVPPLALPGETAHTADILAQSAAVRLFVERAQAMRAGFPLDSGTLQAIVAICTRLDGLPLAIELAAARSKLLPPAALLPRLDHRLALLTGGARDLPARHQTLRGTIAWSYTLLAAGAQTLFRHLAVFVGGCTLEAVEAVCGGQGGAEVPAAKGGRPAPVLLDTLQALLDQNLLQQVLVPNGEPRFTMLETIREYALEQAEASGEWATLRQRHATFYLASAEASEPDQSEWLARLTAEQDNLRAALGWSLEAPRDGAVTLRMACALAWYWYRRGLWAEGRRWLEQALGSRTEHDQQALRAKALRDLADLLWQQGEYADARAHYEASLAGYRELGDKLGMGWVLSALGIGAREQGDAARATVLLEECLALFREIGDDLAVAWACCSLAGVAVMEGDTARALALLEESRHLFQQLDLPIGRAWVLNHLGHVAQLQGRLGRAVALHTESLPLFRDHDQLGTAWALLSLGDTALLAGDPQTATARLLESLDCFRSLGDRKGVGWCLAGLGRVAAAIHRPRRAVRMWGAAAALQEALGTRSAPGEAASQARWEGAAREQVDAWEWAVAWADGLAMTPEQAIACALEEADDYGKEDAVQAATRQPYPRLS